MVERQNVASRRERMSSLVVIKYKGEQRERKRESAKSLVVVVRMKTINI